MANETLFTTRASDYAAGRPAYAAEAVRNLTENLLRSGDVIADIGSGTGLFSAQLLEQGFEVYCVEPNAAMRAEAEKSLFGYSNFHSVPASAENTGLVAGSISLVTAASSFHWFDTEAFRRECRRILIPGGQVCILLNERVYDTFTKAQHTLCERYCPSFKSLAHGLLKTEGKLESFFEEYQRRVFDFPLEYTRRKFIARSLSSSYAPEVGTLEHGKYVDGLNALLDESFERDCVTINNQTVMIWGRVRSEASILTL